MDSAPEEIRKQYRMGAVLTMDALKYFAIIAPEDHSAHALVNEVLVWSAGEASWSSVKALEDNVVKRYLNLLSICDLFEAKTGAMVAGLRALETVLILSDGHHENMVERLSHSLVKTREAMNSLFRNGVVLGATNYLQKSDPFVE